jgi:hypothetical protein
MQSNKTIKFARKKTRAWTPQTARCNLFIRLNVMASSVIKTLSVLALVVVSVSSWANDDTPKFQKGDCITPIVESYSWHRKYATVEAYSSIEGLTKEKSYILAFPFSGSNSTIFSQEIEAATKKVDSSLCGN